MQKTILLFSALLLASSLMAGDDLKKPFRLKSGSEISSTSTPATLRRTCSILTEMESVICLSANLEKDDSISRIVFTCGGASEFTEILAPRPNLAIMASSGFRPEAKSPKSRSPAA